MQSDLNLLNKEIMGHEGKVVIVTGAGRGIGRCVAGAYAAHGAKVILAEKDQVAGEAALLQIQAARGEAALQQIQAARGEAALLQKQASKGDACLILTDVSVPDDVTALVSQAVERYGTVDVLVNNAGFGIWKSPLDLTVEEWDEVISTNLRGAFLCAREAARVMRGIMEAQLSILLLPVHLCRSPDRKHMLPPREELWR